MKSPSPLLVKFSGLKEGIHNFSFDIGNKFFESFEYDDFIDVDITTKLKLEKKTNMLNLDFFFSGKLKVSCDLTMEPFYIDIKTDYSVIVKFAENKDSTDDKIIFLSANTSSIDVSNIIFEITKIYISENIYSAGFIFSFWMCHFIITLLIYPT